MSTAPTKESPSLSFPRDTLNYSPCQNPNRADCPPHTTNKFRFRETFRCVHRYSCRIKPFSSFLPRVIILTMWWRKRSTLSSSPEKTIRISLQNYKWQKSFSWKLKSDKFLNIRFKNISTFQPVHKLRISYLLLHKLYTCYHITRASNNSTPVNRISIAPPYFHPDGIVSATCSRAEESACLSNEKPLSPYISARRRKSMEGASPASSPWKWVTPLSPVGYPRISAWERAGAPSRDFLPAFPYAESRNATLTTRQPDSWNTLALPIYCHGKNS